jgi:hypothetical protein
MTILGEYKKLILSCSIFFLLGCTNNNDYTKIEAQKDSIHTVNLINWYNSPPAKRWRDSTNRADSINKIIEEKEAAKEEIEYEKTPGGRIWKRHPDWDKDDCEQIAKHLI